MNCPTLGTAINGGNGYNALQTDSAYASAASQYDAWIFESALKFGEVSVNGPPNSTTDLSNTYNWSTADYIYQQAQASGTPIMGHVAVWHLVQPTWLTSGNYNATQLEQIMCTWITDVMTRYPNLDGIDVVNETIADSGGPRSTIWSQIPDYICKAFQCARAADPNQKLFIADYGIGRDDGSNTYPSSKKQDFYQQLQSLLAQGCPIDGVSIQGHYRLIDGDASRCPTLAELTNCIQQYQALGLEVRITELDVGIVAPVTQAEIDEQCECFKTVYQAAVDTGVCWVSFWGVADQWSWLNSATFTNATEEPLLMDSNYQFKDCHQEIELIRASAINNPPTSNSFTYTTQKDTPIATTLTGSDPDGDPITYNIKSNPANGTLSGTPPNLTYTPNNNYAGTDSYTYCTIDDQGLQSPVSTITINVIQQCDCSGLQTPWPIIGDCDTPMTINYILPANATNITAGTNILGGTVSNVTNTSLTLLVDCTGSGSDLTGTVQVRYFLDGVAEQCLCNTTVTVRDPVIGGSGDCIPATITRLANGNILVTNSNDFPVDISVLSGSMTGSSLTIPANDSIEYSNVTLDANNKICVATNCP